MFDVRFASGRFVEHFNSTAMRSDIEIRSAQYPVRVRSLIRSIGARRFQLLQLVKNGHADATDLTASESLVLSSASSRQLSLVVSAGHSAPRRYDLLQCYPNPFNPRTMIRYDLAERVRVAIKVSNILGIEVATLADEVQEAGNHSVEFDSDGLPSGVYFYRLTAGRVSIVRKMILTR